MVKTNIAYSSSRLWLFPFYLCVWAHARFACLLSDWAATTGGLLGPATCLPQEDGGIRLSALPKHTTSKLTGLFSTLSLCAERQERKLWIPFFTSLLIWLDLGNEPQVHRLQSGRSNHYAIAPATTDSSACWLPGNVLLRIVESVTHPLRLTWGQSETSHSRCGWCTCLT